MIKIKHLPEQTIRRIYILFLVLFVFSVIIIFQLFNIQILQSEKWLPDGNSARVYSKPLEADRGNILSDDNTVMATSIPYYRVAFDPSVVNEKDFVSFHDTLQKLSKHLNSYFGKELQRDQNHFYNLLYSAVHNAKKDRHVYILPYNRLLDFNEVKWMRSLPIFNRGKFDGGLIVERESSVRFHPLGDLARTTLGIMEQSTNNGARGIEYSYNAILKGRRGTTYVQRVANNVEVPLRYIQEVETRDGADIQTTINATLQDITGSTLAKACRENKAENGVAILMEVNTGQIKAISNYPENYNHALASQYEPGSTFKIASAMAALEDKVISADDEIETGDGQWRFSDRIMKDDHPSGTISFQQVIEKSSNIGIARVITENYRMTPERFIKRLESFGLLDYTDFQIRGEPQPYVIKPGNQLWSNTTLPWLSTGYNIKLTPLQQLTFFNAIANNGKMIQPNIIKEIRSTDGKVKRLEPKILREKICSPQTLSIIKRFMEGVVTRGTAKNINDLEFSLAGKTGTAKEVVNGEYRDLYRSSFAGYFPADNPKYSCIVVINRPKAGQYYGAHVAAPVFRELAQKVHASQMQENYRNPIQYTDSKLSIPASRLMNGNDAKVVYQKLNIDVPFYPNSEFVLSENSNNQLKLHGYSFKRGRVPNVKGMASKDGVALLENLGFKVILKGNGRIRTQNIPPGVRFNKGDAIILFLS